jgi:hypothetical protein
MKAPLRMIRIVNHLTGGFALFMLHACPIERYRTEAMMLGGIFLVAEGGIMIFQDLLKKRGDAGTWADY